MTNENKEDKIIESAHIFRRTERRRGEPAFNLPPVVGLLLLLNLGVFLAGQVFPTLASNEALYALAFVPARYFGGEPAGFPALFSPFTHMFVHAGWTHLLINAGMLLSFGAGLEKRMGGRRMLALYLLSGLIGAFAHAAIYPQETAPMIGASGAISGLFGGIIMMIYAPASGAPDYKKVVPFALLWIAVSVFFGVFGMPGLDNPIAWTAHIGGFIAGLFLYRFFAPR